MSSLQKQPPAARNMGRGSTLHRRAKRRRRRRRMEKIQTSRLSIRHQGPQSYLRMLFIVSLTTQRASATADQVHMYSSLQHLQQFGVLQWRSVLTAGSGSNCKQASLQRLNRRVTARRQDGGWFSRQSPDHIWRLMFGACRGWKLWSRKTSISGNRDKQ